VRRPEPEEAEMPRPAPSSLVALVVALVAGLAAPAARAAEPASPAAPPAARKLAVADLAWLTGTWSGEKDGDRIEETWLPPAAGAMIGAFRWLRGDAVVVYELLALEPDGDSVVLLLRHYRPGLVPREGETEALRFRLVEARDGYAMFDLDDATRPTRVGYRRGDDGSLVAVLERTREGRTTVEEFVYRRR
jgi:hypothetical protein